MVQTPAGPRRVTAKQFTTIDAAAAALLAVEHLNTGDGSVVKEVEKLNERCNVRFNMNILDTLGSPQVGVDQIIASTSPTSTGGSDNGLPCAVIGGAYSRVTSPTAIITGLKGYLQVSPSSPLASLDDKAQYPLLGRVSPSLNDFAVVLVKYAVEVLKINHIVIVHTDKIESQSYSIALQQTAALIAPDKLTIQSFDIPEEGRTPELVKQLIQKCKETDYRYFYGAMNDDLAHELLQEAVRQGIAGTGEHNWMFTGTINFLNRLYPTTAADSAHDDQIGTDDNSLPSIANALPGVASLRYTGQLRHTVFNNLMDKLQKVSSSQDDLSYLLKKLSSSGPSRENDVRSPPAASNETAPGTTFQQPNIFTPIVRDPTFLTSPHSRATTSGWVYDAVIASGLAACQASLDAADSDGNDNTVSYFNGKDHFVALGGVKFEGATGNITFDPATGTRQNANFQISNIRYDDRRSNSTHAAFKSVLTHTYVDGKFTTFEPFIFNDNTTNIPLDLPAFQLEENHLSVGLRSAGYAMCTIIVAMALAASIWTCLHRKSKVVRASQGIFLHLLFAGIVIMGLSIIPLSISDEGSIGAAIPHDVTCDIGCQTFPWFLSVGFSLTFSALWAKTHRVNKLIQNPGFRRMTVSAMDVIRPMVEGLFANVLVLALWTTLSPLHCETEVVDIDKFGRTTETRGYCSSDDSIAYLIALAVINLGSLLFAVYEAYVARHISTEFAETDYIFKSLVVISLVCFIGIPVLVIAHDNPAAYFFVLSAIIFVVCTSLLSLIFGPKIMHHYQEYPLFKNRSEDNSGGLINLPPRYTRQSSMHLIRPSPGVNLREGSSLEVRPTSHNSTSDTSSGQQEGLKILDHPQTQAEMQQEINDLQNELKELKKKLTTQESYNAKGDTMSSNGGVEDNTKKPTNKDVHQDKSQLAIGDDCGTEAENTASSTATERQDQRERTEEDSVDNDNGNNNDRRCQAVKKLPQFDAMSTDTQEA